jgi:DNA repair protein RadC
MAGAGIAMASAGPRSPLPPSTGPFCSAGTHDAVQTIMSKRGEPYFVEETFQARQAGAPGASALALPLGASVGGLSTRERAALGGVGLLSDTELIVLLLATGAVGQPVACVAQALLAEVGGVERLERVGSQRLAQQRGIGSVKAMRLLAAIELGRRVTLRSLCDDREVVGSFEAVAAWAQPRLAGLDHEEVWLLCLDGKNALRSARRIAQGGLHGCALRPADVLRPALEDAASAIVLVHNHPSGDPSPSHADIEMTHALLEACEMLGVYLLDHVIVARSGAASLRELEVFDS